MCFVYFQTKVNQSNSQNQHQIPSPACQGSKSISMKLSPSLDQNGATFLSSLCILSPQLVILTLQRVHWDKSWPRKWWGLWALVPAMLLWFYSLKRQGSYLADLLLDYNHVFMKDIAKGESSDKVSKSPGEGFPKTADGQSSNVLGPSHPVWNWVCPEAAHLVRAACSG